MVLALVGLEATQELEIGKTYVKIRKKKRKLSNRHYSDEKCQITIQYHL